MIATLKSTRLTLRPLALSHCTDRYVEWMNDPQVYQFLETGGNYKIEDLRSYLESVAQNNEMLFWAIHITEGDRHIGNIKIDPVNKRHGLGEYGIMMGDRSEWGKGYADEASRLVLEHCFTDLNLRKITLGVVSSNLAAVHLYKKLGFKIEGRYKDHGLYAGTYHDILRMAIFNPK